MTRFPALQSRDYRIFWIGQAVSLIGTWMQNAVQPYLAYRLTGQPIYLGLIGFAQTLPTLLFTFAGRRVRRAHGQTARGDRDANGVDAASVRVSLSRHHGRDHYLAHRRVGVHSRHGAIY